MSKANQRKSRRRPIEKFLGRDVASEFGFRTVLDPQYPVSRYIIDVGNRRVPKTAIMTVVELEP